MNRKKLSGVGFVASLVITGLIFGAGLCPAKTADENRPARAIDMAAEYPGVVIAKGDDVSMDLIFHNRGRSDETVNVRIAEKPKNWQARIKTYRYTITGLSVPAGEDKTVTFEAEPDKNATPGKYNVRIDARTPDGRFKMTQTVAVEIKAKGEKTKKSSGVKLTTSYPVIRGPSDATFEFSVEVNSRLDKDAVFDLLAQGPKNWEINFKPAYESKFISSLRIKANQSSTVAVQVKPISDAKAGKYPIKVRVGSGDAQAETTLYVILTGTYGLEVGTPNGLLSLDARQGKPANMSIYVKNTGSAANHDIKFMSFKPENWKVKFNPEKIDLLAPNDLKQVEVTITPYRDALVGDYSVSINVKGEKASKVIELRTTVKASSAWGWIGIGIIVLVIGGLFGLFRWLGRR